MRLRALFVRVWVGVAAFATLAVSVRPVPAQDPVFRAESSLLELEVRATDARGRALDSLQREDFAVYENGEPREIVGFEYVPKNRLGVSVEVRPATVHRLLVLFDVSPGEVPRALPFVERFVRERLPEGLLTSMNGLEFTTDKATLLRELRDQAWTSDALASAGASMIDPVLSGIGIGEVEDYSANLVEDQFGRAKVHRYLRLVGALAQFPGRKSVVLFSPGFPMGYDYGSGTFQNTQDVDLLDVLRGEATRGRVRFYTVDIRGLNALNAASDASANSLSPETGAGLSGPHDSMGASTDLLLAQNGLAVLANHTGGEAILNQNDLGKAFDPVLRDDGGYYLISYAMPDADRPGAARNIEVRVKRRGARLDYQRRYYDRESFLAVVGATPSSRPSAAPSEAFEQYRMALAALDEQPANLDAAVAAVERAVAADPSFAMPWTLLGNLKAALGQADEAREAFERAIAADPKAVEPYWGQIQMAAAEGDWRLVRAEAARLLEERPGEPRGLFAAALAEWNLENVDAAEEAARRAVETGEFPRAYKILGLALAARGDMAAAVEAYEAYLEREPGAADAAEIREQLAGWRDAAELERLRAMTEEGRWGEAAELSARLLAEDRRATDAHFFHALAQFNLGRNELAAEHARMAAAGETAAGLPEIRYLLGLLAAQAGDTATAAAEYRAYLAAKPDSEMASEIQARIDEWEALAVRERAGPVSPLEELRARVQRTLEAVPNYACAVVMERGDMAPKTGREHAKAVARAERAGKPAPEPVYDRRDRIRLDVAMIGGRELFSWPGESEFSERPLGEMIGYGAASTGDYALHARNLFVEQETVFQAAGSEMLDGRSAERYVYAVPVEESRFAVQQDRAQTVVPYDGVVWASGAELAAIELVVRAFPTDFAVEWSRTRIEYQSVALGGESFLLPRVSDALIRFRSGAQNALRTTFQDCRSYGAESAITFGVEPQEMEEPSAEGGPEEVSLPLGTELRVQLESAIRSEEAMVGDAIEGVLEKALPGDLAEIFPAGSRVLGRIRRLDYLMEPGPHYVLGIELTRVESGRRFARIEAEMSGVSGLSGRVDVASTVDGMRPWRSMGDGAAWKTFIREWDGGRRSGGSLAYYERFLAGVGLLFVHGKRLELEPGLVTHWVTGP